MKVVHLCKVYFPTKGGVQRVIAWICNGLDVLGFEFRILTTAEARGPEKLSDNTTLETTRSLVEWFSMPISPLYPFAMVRRIKEADLVCIHYPFPIVDLVLGLLPKPRAKTIVYWHSEIVSQRRLARLFAPFTRRMLQKCDAVVVSSPALIEHSSFLSQFKSKCLVIPFGVPLSLENDNKIKAPSQSDYFLLVGRHVKYKGIEVAINAFYQFQLERKSVTRKLVIVGSGPLISKHRRLIADLQLGESVVLKEGVTDAELNKLIENCKCLIMSSVLPSEAFGLVQIEAMARGRPVINTSLSSGVPWVARHLKEGITVTPGCKQSLCDAITKLETQDELVDRLGEAARSRYSEKFTYQKFVMDTKQLYSQMIEDG